MSIAPEAYLRSYLKVLQKVFTVSRAHTLDAQHNLFKRILSSHHEKTTDLLDAAHIIPELLNNWDKCDEPGLREMLKEYDKKWAKTDNDFSLLKIFNEEFNKETK